MEYLSFDTKTLIKSVEAQRCIWDPSHEDYMNRTVTQLAWVQVAKDVDSQWRERSESQKSELLTTILKKWRHLRDYYVKERKRGNLNKSRNSANLTLMGFLSTIQQKSKSRNIVIVKNETPLEFDELDEDSSDGIQSAISETDTQAQHSEYVTNPPPPPAPFEQAIQTTDLSEDPDRGFLMSLLPEMRAMNDVEKFNFKYEVMTAIKRIRYSASDPFN